MTINISGYTFEGKFSSTSSLNDKSGVYVILNSNDKVIDVGESQGVQTRVENHSRESCWKRETTSIYYAAYYTNESNREDVADKIRRAHNPPCGDR